MSAGAARSFCTVLPWPASGDLLDALIANDYVSVAEDGAVEVQGNADCMRLRAARAAAGKRGQSAKAEDDARRQARAAKRREARKAAAKPAPKPTPAKRRTAAIAPKSTATQDANRAAWNAYDAAYQTRWGVVPVRNAKVNSLIAQFVQRVGHDLAPQVLGFFVRHNERDYLRSHHSLNLAVRDAEGLTTQFNRDTPITTRDVMRFEEAQTPNDQMARIDRGEL